MGKNISSKLSTGVKASLVYTIASLLTRGLAIITVPIFTRLMSTEQIGIVNLYTSWNSTLEIIATLALTYGGFSVAMKDFPNDRDRYISSILTLTTCVSLCLIIIFFIFSDKLTVLLGISKKLVWLMLFGFIFTPARDFFLTRQRYEYKYKMSGFVTMSSAIVASLVSVFSVLIASKRGVENLGSVRLFSNNIVVYGVAFVFWIYLFIKGGLKVNFFYWKYSLLLSIPLMGNAFATQVLHVSDRIMISKIINNSAVGIYSILYSASSISLIIWSAINNSFVPFLFENIEKEDKKKVIKKISTEIIVVYGLVAFLITLIAPEIIKILATAEYYESIYIMPPIAAGVFLTAIHNLYANVLIYHKKTQYIMIATFLAAIVNICLNFWGIHKYGYMAAAYTTLVANVVLALFQVFVSKRVHYAKVCNKNETVYNDNFIFIFSMIIIILCILCIPLYNFIFIRYFLVFIFVLLSVIFRKQLIAIFRGTNAN